MNEIRPIEFKDDVLYLIDQRKIPIIYELYQCKTYIDVDFAIKDMVVRGAPAIGVVAAYGAVLGAKELVNESKDEFVSSMHHVLDVLNQSRPTAVNLMWAVKQMRKLVDNSLLLSNEEIYAKLKIAADDIYADDIKINKAIGKNGNELVPSNAHILTHCNAGALATAGYGTALGVVRAAFYDGKDILVYADETRPRLQGGRLTAWELMQEDIPVCLIADNAAATLMRDGKIDLVVVGADRIASNGDTANKIGTFMLSVIAKAYNVPFYIAAPVSTIDFDIETGADIVIEERDGSELTSIEGIRTAPQGIAVYNPAFDVTPNENITAIITEKGIVRHPNKQNISKLKDN